MLWRPTAATRRPIHPLPSSAARKALTLTAYCNRCIKTPSVSRADPICGIAWPIGSTPCRKPQCLRWQGPSRDRLLVTGASGFLGRATIAAFAQNGYALRAAVRRQPDPALPSGIEVVQHPDLSEDFRLATPARRCRSSRPPCRNCAYRPRRAARTLRSNQSAGDGKARGCRGTSRRRPFCICLFDPGPERTCRGPCVD